MEPTIIEHKDRTGITRELNIDITATSPFGFAFQDYVRTPFGPGRVIGVHNGNLHFKLDVDEGVSYWSKCKTPADFIARGFLKLEEDLPPQSSKYCHKLKRVEVFGKRRVIVMQRENGPCPMIAAANALLLQGKLESISSQTDAVVACDILCQAVLEHISNERRPVFFSQSVADEENTLAKVFQKDADAIRSLYIEKGSKWLEKFYDGIDVSPYFAAVDSFEYSEEMALFALAGCRVLHGWLIDSGKFAPLKNESYNSLTAKATDPDFAHTTLGNEFLEQTQTQLTEFGLKSLFDSLEDGEVAVLFRNNHFGTIIRHGDQLFSLVSDEGFAERQLIVFETLGDISGQHAVLCDGDGCELAPQVLKIIDKCGNKYTLEQMTTAYAAAIDDATPDDQIVAAMIKFLDPPSSTQSQNPLAPQFTLTAEQRGFAETLMGMGVESNVAQSAASKHFTLQAAFNEVFPQ